MDMNENGGEPPTKKRCIHEDGKGNSRASQFRKKQKEKMERNAKSIAEFEEVCGTITYSALHLRLAL